MNKDLKILALYYNEQYVYTYLPNFIPNKVRVEVISALPLGKSKKDPETTVYDTIIRASCLIDEFPRNKTHCMVEKKWEGPLHIWWEAVMENAKSFVEIVKE
jgi:hypothetical protein